MLAEINAGEGQRVVRKEPLHHPPVGGALVVRCSWYTRIKGPLEWVAALVLLILALPLILLSALLVKLTSQGPAFYSQTRVGRHGRPYTIHKIRTMRHDAENGTGPRWATTHDPRVTPIGRFLRQTHLDELPQLWNVLRGEMSLIGPRPERPEFVAQLATLIPYYRERLLVRPGVSGLAQVELPADTDLESVRRKLAHDLYYLQCISFGMDLKIVLLTVCDLFGIRSSFSRWLFAVPEHAEVERAYQRLLAGEKEVARMQSA